MGRPPNGRNRTIDHYHFEVDEWTDHGYFPWMDRGGRPDEYGLSTSWTDSDDRPWSFVLDGRWTKRGRPRHERIQTMDHSKYKKRGRKWTGGQMDESPSVEAWFSHWNKKLNFTWKQEKCKTKSKRISKSNCYIWHMLLSLRTSHWKSKI